MGNAAFALLLSLTRLMAIYGCNNATLPAWLFFSTFACLASYSGVGIMRDLFPWWMAGSRGAVVQKGGYGD